MSQVHQPKIHLGGKKRYYTRSLRKENLLKMYNNNGRLSKELPDAKIAPNRKWFGNTRTITQEELASFQNAYKEIKNDQFQVIIHEKKLPKSLVHDEEEKRRFALLKAESFQDTFGKKATRRKPNLPKLDLHSLMLDAADQEENFAIKKMKEASKTGNIEMGQTKRVLGEVYKVIDSSDVIIEVLDARDPLGTRSRKLEEFMAKETPHKHLIFLINKCDLVPRWVVEKAIRRLTRERPTLAFRASTTKAFGNDQLIALLRQFQTLHSNHAHLCVGFVGYPNVGKSSVINSLKRDNVCPVAPIAGETKVWRYIALSRKIYLIDCPGHVYPEDVTDAERILRGVTRTERIVEPEHYIQYIVDRVRPQYLQRTYGIEPFDGPDDLLEKVARRLGRLGKGGKPDVHEASIQLIRDFQRGKLPWFVLVHSKDIENPLERQHGVKVERADLNMLQRTVEFDQIDEVEVEDDAEEMEQNKMEEQLEKEEEANYPAPAPSDDDELLQAEPKKREKQKPKKVGAVKSKFYIQDQ
ncbi:Nucleolar GTP-binding protein 2 [Histomonas meleagridis]|uniref:Nucleolar GTP-binding protein 2 n=1 Tax=Histomonas meleagridis TaxID=135588 RepID=UPI00355A3FD1|nr:Nucleolar GTP-binding protein 2 [Histomonas meleagridis]KAH0804473.1 Nucleolar GTP-binding protein 2 [Histomonas meleagridis]